MFDYLLYEIANYKWMVVINVTAAFILCGFYWLVTAKLKWNKKVLKYFSLVAVLNKKQLVGFGLIISRCLFILTTSIYCEKLNIGYLFIMLLPSFVILAVDHNIKNFGFDVFNHVLIFALVFIESLLFKYYLSVENYWPILVMSIMVGLFSILYGVFQGINSYDYILGKWSVTNE